MNSGAATPDRLSAERQEMIEKWDRNGWVETLAVGDRVVVSRSAAGPVGEGPVVEGTVEDVSATPNGVVAVLVGGPGGPRWFHPAAVSKLRRSPAA